MTDPDELANQVRGIRVQTFVPIFPRSLLKPKIEKLEEAYMLSCAVHVGHTLDLFRTMAIISSKDQHVSAEDLAGVASCKPRYITEWLAIMAVSDILEVDSEDKFWIREEDYEVLLDKSLRARPSTLFRDSNLLPKVIECMKLDTPKGIPSSEFYSKHRQLRDPCDHMYHLDEIQALCNASLEGRLLGNLKAGDQKILELGCGDGGHLAVFATLYPLNRYFGVDSDKISIELASQRKQLSRDPFTNLEFHCMDAIDLPQDWVEQFDMVFLHFAVHDMSRPDKCFAECFRILKPNGVMIMLDAACQATIYENRQMYGHDAVLPYCISLFQCLPLSSNDEDSLCLGAMCSKDRFLKLIYGADFNNVQLHKICRIPDNARLYTCYKDPQRE